MELAQAKRLKTVLSAETATADDAATSKIEFAESKVSVTAGSAAKSLDLSQFDQNFTVDVNGSAEKFTNSQIHFSKDHKYTITINDMADATTAKALAETASGGQKLSSSTAANDKTIANINMHCKMPTVLAQNIQILLAQRPAKPALLAMQVQTAPSMIWLAAAQVLQRLQQK